MDDYDDQTIIASGPSKCNPGPVILESTHVDFKNH